MKKILILMTVALLVAGCKKNDDLAKVRVYVNNFEITQDDLPTRDPQPVADYSGIKAVTLAFYTSEGVEYYKTTQLKDDPSTFGTTFGVFDLSLPMASYTMVAVAYKTQDDSPFTLISPTQAAYTGAHMLETFAATQSVTVANTTALSLTTTLSRVVSMVKVVSTDGRTANASNISITMSGGSKSFNPTTGLASNNNGFINTVGISAVVGATSTSGSYLFLVTDEQSMDITIDVLDADGASISHKEVANVPFKRNRKTVLTGSLYDASASSSFSVNTEWLTDHTMGF